MLDKTLYGYSGYNISLKVEMTTLVLNSRTFIRRNLYRLQLYVYIYILFILSYRKLNDTFGECGRPHIGWQIDPFGHSRQMATLFSQFGYDGLFFGRLDYEDKGQRLMNKTAEMIWQSSPNLGKYTYTWSKTIMLYHR